MKISERAPFFGLNEAGLNEAVWRLKMKISEKSTSKYLQSGASSAFTCLNIALGVNVGMSADQPEYYLE